MCYVVISFMQPPVMKSVFYDVCVNRNKKKASWTDFGRWGSEGIKMENWVKMRNWVEGGGSWKTLHYTSRVLNEFQWHLQKWKVYTRDCHEGFMTFFSQKAVWSKLCWQVGGKDCVFVIFSDRCCWKFVKSEYSERHLMWQLKTA